MTWEWVVLILGILYGIFALVGVFVYVNEEKYEYREGSMFAPTVERRTGPGSSSYERKEQIKGAEENNHVH
jgi:hypothetical protein